MRSSYLQRRSKYALQLLGILLVVGFCFSFFSCSLGGKNYFQDRESRFVFALDSKLENKIDQELNKRKRLVQGNPLYLSLVTELAKGRSLLKGGNPKAAFGSFDQILQNEKYANYPEYSFAKYYLAVTLHKLGVDYGALLYFVDILEKEPLRIHSHESLGWAIKLAQKLKDDELILFLASTITADKVPLSLREEFRYFIAKDLYKKKNHPKAVQLLEAIPTRNRLYLASQYLLGTIATQENQYRNAIKFFREISDSRSKVDYYEEGLIRELSNLALGRIFYEEKNYPLSIVYYKKIPKEAEYFPSALYESSWALFKLNKFNEALSVVHSLHTPFFNQVYFLKSYFMEGATYLELCLYQDAVNSLSRVEIKFQKLKKQIEEFARRARSPKEYYPLLSGKTSLPNGKFEYTYEDLFHLAAANRDFLSVHRYLVRLKKERKILADLNKPRADLLARLLQQRENDLTLKASWLAGQKLRLTRQLIEEFFALQDYLRYEIVSSERKILQTRSLRLAPPVLTDEDLIRPKFTESLKETMLWWEYRDEAWKDEIGSYLYNLKSLCKDTGDKKR